MAVNPAGLRAPLKDDSANFLVASSPGGIEAQEAQGQEQFVLSDQMPVDCPRSELEQLGFVFGEVIDDLFVQASLPPGWKKIATDHDMWSSIVDETGMKRVSIFYKAAFYDRRARAYLVKPE